MSRLLSEAPAKLCGLSSKGSIQVGKDADLVIFDPDDSFKVTKDIILHKHKVTPYLGKTLRGRVIRTYVRGNEVFRKGQQFPPPQGKFLRRSWNRWIYNLDREMKNVILNKPNDLSQH